MELLKMTERTLRTCANKLVKGGRLRKTTHGIVSFAPFLSSVSAITLAAVLYPSMISTAIAGKCEQSGQVRECSGPIDEDDPIVITVPANESLTLRDADDFVLNTGTGNAGIEIATNALSNFVTIDFDAGGEITAGNRAVYLNHQGTGDINIDVAGSINSVFQEGILINTAARSGSIDVTAGNFTTGDDAIDINHMGTGGVSVTVEGNIVATTTAQGIDISTTTDNTGGVTVSAGNIQTADESINIDHQGSGAVMLITAADTRIISTAEEGIILTTGSAVEGVTAILNGNIGVSASSRAEKSGARIYNNGDGALDIDITGDIYAKTTGLYAHSDGSVLDINVDSRIDGLTRGIAIANDANEGTDSVVVRLGDNAVVSGFVAISLQSSRPSSETAVYLGGSVMSTDTSGGRTGTAVNFSGTGDFTRRAVIEAGRKPTISGNINSGTTTADAIIELAGAGDDTFNLETDLEPFISFDQLHKTGTGTWTLAGMHPTSKAFNQINVNQGRFLLDIDPEPSSETPALNFTGDSPMLSISDGATLEINEDIFTAGGVALNLAGNLHLSNTTGGINVLAINADGGSVTVDVDFGQELGFARLSSTSVTTSQSIPVHINLIGTAPDVSAEEDEEEGEGEAVIEQFIEIMGSADPGAFIIGDNLARAPFIFELRHAAVPGASAGTTVNRWSLVAMARPEASIDEGLYETLPAALAQLASLESYHMRLAGRQYVDNMATWGKITGASSEVEPNSTSLATYDIENAKVEFGISFPLGISNPDIDGDFALGANVAFGDSTTDVSVSGAGGKITTDSVAVGVSVGYEDERAYFEGQLQYTGFDNVLESDEKLADIDATAFSASAEVGYAVKLARLNAAFLGNLPDLTLIPSAQLRWSRIDFKDFTANETEVRLDRGSVIDGRVGVAVEKQTRGMLLHGRTNVIMPLDGEVGVIIADEPVTSEREDPVLDIGIGAAYEWDDAYAISADISTQQGSEIEGYAAKVGFRYEF